MATPDEITDLRPQEPPPGTPSPWVDGARSETGIAVVAPDPAWQKQFARVERRIREALGPLALGVEHVGSTSVPGLPAKPVIDVDLAVAAPADEDAWVPALERAGFRLVVREEWWHQHRVLRGTDPRSNVHVFRPGSPEPVRHRLFRDWLRAHREDRELYARTKLRAAEEANAAGEDVMAYNARKEPVIHDIYRRAFVAAGLLTPASEDS